MARARLVILNLGVLAVWHLGEEDARVSLRVECLFLLGNLYIRLVVSARSWILARRELPVLNINGRFKDLTLVLRSLEVADCSPVFDCVHIGVVQSWSNGVEPTTSVHVHINFL